MKLANKNDKIPKSIGPKPRAINKPVANENIAFIRFEINEKTARLVGVKIFLLYYYFVNWTQLMVILLPFYHFLTNYLILYTLCQLYLYLFCYNFH